MCLGGMEVSGTTGEFYSHPVLLFIMILRKGKLKNKRVDGPGKRRN